MQAEAIRSVLFVPADREDRMLKALATQADAVILDLEDAVAPERKAYARSAARAVLEGAARACEKPVFVRINAFDTGLAAQDLAGVLGGGPFGIVLPKASGGADLWRLSHMLDALEAREDITLGQTRILSIATETAAATLGLSEAGLASKMPPRLCGLLWGGEDLAAALGAASNREMDGSYSYVYQLARAQTLLAANAWEVAAIDAVCTEFRDLTLLEHEAQLARRDGFTAKAAIHPAQIEVINRILTPSAAEIDVAAQILAALEETGVAQLNGRMVDIAHKRIALRVMARAKALNVL